MPYADPRDEIVAILSTELDHVCTNLLVGTIRIASTTTPQGEHELVDSIAHVRDNNAGKQVHGNIM